MTLRYTYTRPEDGGVDIVTAAPKERLELVLGPLTDEAYEAHVLERSIPKDAIGVQKMPDDWEPESDRYFRNAWKQNGQAVEIDMPKAREIQKQKLRQARAPLLARLDTDYMRADEVGDAKLKAEITVRKQHLRDITKSPDIAAASTPDELKLAGRSVLSG